MAQEEFVAKLNYLCSNIDYIEDFLIYAVQKNNKEYCKIYNGCLKHFLASITKYLPEEKIHCFAIKCYIVLWWKILLILMFGKGLKKKTIILFVYISSLVNLFYNRVYLNISHLILLNVFFPECPSILNGVW